MPSFKAHLVAWYIRFQFRASFQTGEALRNRIKSERQTHAQRQQPPPYIRKQCTITERQENGYPVYELSPKSTLAPSRARVLYLYGSSFIFDPTSVHWEFAAMLVDRLQATITMPLYPLAPENNLSEVYDFLQPIYDRLAASLDGPFWTIGDSIGGTLGVALSQQALGANRPVASRLALISPMVDHTLSNPEVYVAEANDPWLSVAGLKAIPPMFDPELDPADPLLSPLYGDYEGLPPMIVFAAERDLTTPDIKKFVVKAKEKGREAVLVQGDGMLHDWPLLPIPEATVAVGRLIQFIQEGS